MKKRFVLLGMLIIAAVSLIIVKDLKKVPIWRSGYYMAKIKIVRPQIFKPYSGEQFYIIENQDLIPVSFDGYDTKEILEFNSENEDGSLWNFQQDPVFFRCHLEIESKYMEQIAGITDNIWSPNPIHSIQLEPIFRQGAYQHISTNDRRLLRRNKSYLTSKVFDCFARTQAWGPVVKSFRKIVINEKDSVVCIFPHDSLDFGFLFLWDRSFFAQNGADKIIQYPIVINPLMLLKLTGINVEEDRLSSPFMLTGLKKKLSCSLLALEDGKFILVSGCSDGDCSDVLRRKILLVLPEANKRFIESIICRSGPG